MDILVSIATHHHLWYIRAHDYCSPITVSDSGTKESIQASTCIPVRRTCSTANQHRQQQKNDKNNSFKPTNNNENKMKMCALLRNVCFMSEALPIIYKRTNVDISQNDVREGRRLQGVLWLWVTMPMSVSVVYGYYSIRGVSPQQRDMAAVLYTSSWVPSLATGNHHHQSRQSFI